MNRPAVQNLAACYAIYMVAAAFGQWMTVSPAVSITVWPPNGVMLAILLANDRRSWPWWIVIAAAGEQTGNLLWFGNPVLPALGYVIANALETVVGALALRSFFAPPLRLTTLKQVLALLGITVLAPVIGATLGASIDSATGKNPFLMTWVLWWLGDATGILIATPLVMSALNAWREGAVPTLAQLIEATAIALIFVGLGAWLYYEEPPFVFIFFVPMLWAALRFESRGSALAVLMIALLVGFYSRGSIAQTGAEDTAAYQHGMLQLFVFVSASTGMIVAVIIRQYRQAISDIALSNTDLEQRVLERTRALEAIERRFKTTFENAAVAMSILDKDATLIRVNDPMAKMLGYNAGEIEGCSLDQFTHPDDVAKNHLAWEELKSDIADHYELEKRYIRKDGEMVWGHTSVSCVRGPNREIEYLIKVIQNITARKRADEFRQTLMNELNHRIKNLISTIQSIARQTADKTPDRFLENFSQRLQALAANQDLLVKRGWENVNLEELLRSQLSHFGAILDHQINIDGPAVFITARGAQAIAMAIHELATNAAKYGSLSNDTGRVEISWDADGDTFQMSWRETGGPRVQEPARSGFGSTVIKTLIQSTLSADVSINFASTGFIWQIKCTASSLCEEA